MIDANVEFQMPNAEVSEDSRHLDMALSALWHVNRQIIKESRG
jgi:hypothetical protein